MMDVQYANVANVKSIFQCALTIAAVALVLLTGGDGTVWEVMLGPSRAVGAEDPASDDGEKQKVEQEEPIAPAVKEFLEKKLEGQVELKAEADARSTAKEFAAQANRNPKIRELLDGATWELSEDRIDESFSADPNLQAEILTTVGLTYWKLHDYRRATEFLKRAMELYRALFGPEDAQTLNSMLDLAEAYLQCRKPDLAAPLYEEAFKLDKAKLGPDHPETLMSMSMLGWCYLQSGKCDLGLTLLEEALNLYKAKFGPDHPDTMACIRNLGWCYLEAGKLDLALPLAEESLKLTKAKFGPDDPQTFTSMNDLATVYMKAGKLDLAGAQLKEILNRSKAKFGPDHPDTMRRMETLALFCMSVHKANLAVPLHEQLVELSKAKLGTSHSDTKRRVKYLAEAKREARKGEIVPATDVRAGGNVETDTTSPDVALLEETVKLYKARLGGEHPDTIRQMNVLATAYLETDQAKLALPLFEEAFTVSKEKIGADDPVTIECMSRLGSAYVKTGKAKLAVPLLEEALTFDKAHLGAADPKTIVCMSQLAGAYLQTDKAKVAVPLLEETFQLCKATLGPGHPQTIECMNELAAAYLQTGKAKQAVPLLEEIFHFSNAILGPGDPETIQHMNRLVSAYLGAGEPERALLVLEESSSAQPENSELTLKVAALAAWFGREKEFTACVKRGVRFARRSKDPVTTAHTAEILCLRPSDDERRLTTALELARTAVEEGQKSDDLPYFRMVLGMAEYRNGHYAAAEEALLAAAKGYEDDSYLGVVSAFYRAISLYREGKQDEARELATSVVKNMTPLPNDDKKPFADNGTVNDVIAWVTYREVQAVIGLKERAASNAGEKN